MPPKQTKKRSTTTKEQLMSRLTQFFSDKNVNSDVQTTILDIVANSRHSDRVTQFITYILDKKPFPSLPPLQQMSSLLGLEHDEMFLPENCEGLKFIAWQFLGYVPEGYAPYNQGYFSQSSDETIFPYHLPQKTKPISNPNAPGGYGTVALAYNGLKNKFQPVIVRFIQKSWEDHKLPGPISIPALIRASQTTAIRWTQLCEYSHWQFELAHFYKLSIETVAGVDKPVPDLPEAVLNQAIEDGKACIERLGAVEQKAFLQRHTVTDSFNGFARFLYSNESDKKQSKGWFSFFLQRMLDDEDALRFIGILDKKQCLDDYELPTIYCLYRLITGNTLTKTAFDENPAEKYALAWIAHRLLFSEEYIFWAIAVFTHIIMKQDSFGVHERLFEQFSTFLKTPLSSSEIKERNEFLERNPFSFPNKLTFSEPHRLRELLQRGAPLEIADNDASFMFYMMCDMDSLRAAYWRCLMPTLPERPLAAFVTKQGKTPEATSILTGYANFFRTQKPLSPEEMEAMYQRASSHRPY